MKYNKRNIMVRAWELVKKFGKTMSEALRIAWSNAKALVKAKTENGVTEKVRTWYGWKSVGMEVIHDSKCLFQVVVVDPRTKSGTRKVSYFGESQVAPVEG